ncbi:DUF4142 domain-containing protein [Alcaligenes endophyticus]|uniref:DUF4142 domain-containing protein n=1 Tax=Alcaligenes endophyticus TaxID=1929088 RepID=A0ABT8EM87_9BURK|nr:DUF4142 domain-containing protein [Alcaligenes endophyticus]MCX5591004.1 DUF4142 domain-containing protein [Alcaligenes endophyticus]MDN4122419.1 DUF4142 domain-containing protein [Alcaligenes endophyticus]
MRNRHWICMTFAAALVLGMGLRSAQAVDMFSEEKGFIEDAAHAGNYEMEAAHYALEYSTDPRVKDYAQMMVDEHKQLAQALQQIAARLEIDMPEGPSLMQKAKLTLLKSKEGRDFDADYAQKLGVAAHEETIKRFQDYIERGKDREVLGFANDALPILQQHFQHATVLYRSMQSPSP